MGKQRFCRAAWEIRFQLAATRQKHCSSDDGSFGQAPGGRIISSRGMTNKQSESIDIQSQKEAWEQSGENDNVELEKENELEIQRFGDRLQN